MPSPPPEQGTLAQKLVEIMLEVEALHKDARNDFHKYRFASAENVFRALRGPLASRGVLLLPSITRISEREFTTPGGKGSTLTTINLSMCFCDAATGERITCTWAGAGDDPADKGLYKAMTGGVRTFLRDTFLLPQGDDPELDKRTDERATRRLAAPAREPLLTSEQVDRMIVRVLESGLAASQVETFLAAAGIPVGDPLRVTARQAKQVAAMLEERAHGAA